MRRLLCSILLMLCLAACTSLRDSGGQTTGSASPPSDGAARTVTRTLVAYHSPGFSGKSVPVYGALIEAMDKKGRSIDRIRFGTRVQVVCYVPGVKDSYGDLYWLTLPGNNAPVWASADLFVRPLKSAWSHKPLTDKYWTNQRDPALPLCVLT